MVFDAQAALLVDDMDSVDVIDEPPTIGSATTKGRNI
jgi:hypothetical protein